MKKAILFFFTLLSVLCFLSAAPYREELEEGPAIFSFLPKGSYTLEITYENSPAGNQIFARSDVMADENNRMGTLFSQLPLEEGSGVVRLPLTLEQPSYQIHVGTVLDQKNKSYLSKVLLQSNHLLYKDSYFLSALFLFSGIALTFLFRRMSQSKSDAPSDAFLGYPERYTMPLVLTALGLLASLPLFSDFILCGDDIHFHLARLEGIYQGIASGDFPVRIMPQQMSGYGTITGAMYPQLFLYPAAMLRFLGVSLMLCYKLLITAINIATAFSSYYGVKNISKSRDIALWSSILYTLSAYRLCNVYVRGALGESLAMIFLPLVLWGTWEILWGDKRRWLLLSLSMTGVLGSHLLSTQLCALFMALELIYWLFSKKRDCLAGRIWSGCKAVGVTLLLNATFLVPFLFFCGENFQCFHIPFEVSDSVAYFSQMFSFFPSATGKSLPPGTTLEEMPITIGGVLLIGSMFFVLALVKERDLRQKNTGIHCLIYGGVAVLLSSWLFPWKKVAQSELLRMLCSSLQFSWRFLGPATVFLCLVSAMGIVWLAEENHARPGTDRTELPVPGNSDKPRLWIYGCMAVLVLLSTASLFDNLSQHREQHSDKRELESWDLSDGMYVYQDSEEFRPIQLDYGRGEAVIMTSRSTRVEYSDYRKRGSHISVKVTPLEKEEDYLMFPLYWYPGYEIKVNGEKVPVSPLTTLVCCPLPMEPAVIEVRYRGFWFFQAADLVTLITFCAILVHGIVTGIHHAPRRHHCA